jgi:hypothetical protein
MEIKVNIELMKRISHYVKCICEYNERAISDSDTILENETYALRRSLHNLLSKQEGETHG